MLLSATLFSLVSHFSRRLSESWEQASLRPKNESLYRCGLVGITVWAHTGYWEEMCSTQWRYGHIRNELWEKFRDGVEMARWDFNGYTYFPNFYCGYFLRYDQTINPRKEAPKYGKEVSQFRGFPFAVGQMWTGILRRSWSYIKFLEHLPSLRFVIL